MLLYFSAHNIAPINTRDPEKSAQDSGKRQRSNCLQSTPLSYFPSQTSNHQIILRTDRIGNTIFVIIGTASNSAFYILIVFISFFLPLFSIGLFQTISYLIHCITDNICFLLYCPSLFYNVLSFYTYLRSTICAFCCFILFRCLCTQYRQVGKCKSADTHAV